MLKKKHVITDYVFGENWGNINESTVRMTLICPQLMVDENLHGNNSGVSVILV